MTDTPEILPVTVSDLHCKIHNFFLVSYPRNAGEFEDDGEQYAKCPLRSCDFGQFIK